MRLPRVSPGVPLRAAVLSLVAALCTGLLVLVGGSSHAAPFGRLHPPGATPIAGVGFPVEGYLSSKKMRRPVRLQARSGSSWTTIEKGTSTRKGTFAFAGVVLARTSELRVFAPAYRMSKKARSKTPAITTKPVTVTVLPQTSHIDVVPPVVQQGAAPAAPAEGAQVVAGFTPARAGRSVRLEVHRGGAWHPVTRGAQDPSGHVSFVAPAGESYRAVAEAAGGAPEVVTTSVSTRDWSLVVQDTFDGGALNAALWDDHKRENGSSDVRTCARIDPSVRRVGDGVLHLGVGYDPTRAGETCQYVAEKGPGSYPYLLNSQVASEKRFGFTHGVAAARMKVQQAQGMHSGFWMQPTGQPQAGNPAAGVEIDVMEFFGQTKWGKEGVGSFLHWIDGQGVKQKYGEIFSETSLMKPAGDTWWDSFHVFSVEWTPEQYIFRVDGREYYRESRAVSRAGQYLIFSMLTSNYELEHLAAEELGQTAQVDWVRVWK